MNITFNITGDAPNETVLAEVFRELAGRLERNEIRRGMSGEVTENCDICEESARLMWSITAPDEAETEDDDTGAMDIQTPFGTIRVVPFAIN